LVDEAYERYKSVSEGENSSVYPALARVPSDLFGICVVGTSGNVYAVGEAEHEFTIMSVSKPFVFALVCDAVGVETVRERVGANATGLPFNSLEGVERGDHGRTNPMVNSGAIATTVSCRERRSRPNGSSSTSLSRFAGRSLPLNGEVYASATRPTSQPERRPPAAELASGCTWTGRARPRCTAVLAERQRPGSGGDGRDARRRRRQSTTTRRVVDPIICHYTLAVMATAGVRTSGDWLYDIGLPGRADRRWHRNCPPGRRPSHIRPAARSGRQQRQGNWSRYFCPKGSAWSVRVAAEA
jgi:glutaminase